MNGGRRAGRQSCGAAVLCVACAIGVRGAAPHAKKATCATCHPAQARPQPATGMGIGMELPPDQRLLREHPKLTLEANGYRYRIESAHGKSTYTVSDGSGELTLPVRYAFGVQSETFVLEYGGRFYESLVSYYHPLKGLGITLGDEGLRPRSLVEAIGRQTSDQEIAACFDCHGTGGVKQGKLALDSLQPGVTCEHCHAGAGKHMQAIAAGKAAAFPRKLGTMAAEEMSNFCGQCHRTWETVVSLGLFGEKNVRFQPYRLANSRCFLGDDRRIRCTACHDPHTELVRDDASYDRACLSCHDLKGAAPVGAGAATPKACPAGDRDCVSCHMPKVRMPAGQAIFTDHQIRVVHAGDPYPN